ncbi:MAG: UDP-N-acetylmuramoyl-L-alanyl-D-glutamate--2,6-diaminopimelate ligase [Rhodothermales bacterium]
MKTLKELTDRLAHAGLIQRRLGLDETLSIDHLANDSRKVGPGGLFVAIRGGQTDGHMFIEKTVLNGAIAIVCEAMPEEARERFPGIAFVQVRDARAALAELAACFYGDPTRELRLVGVTGTNGKTTTAYLMHHLFETLGVKTGLLSTIEYRIGAEVLEATHTTPDVLDTNRLFRRMVDEGCGACSMEVSSHALDQERVRAFVFAAALFTNLTRDHLDYHGSMDAYRDAKKRLFDTLSPDAAAVYNADDPAGAYMVSGTRARATSFGRTQQADVLFDILGSRLDGLRLRLDGTERRFRLVGAFNAYNLAGAYAAGRALGYGAAETIDALCEARPVPGRFEYLTDGRNRTVIVDYAHTPDALENILRAVRDVMPPDARLWCVFGCGGDRDRDKRRIMGSIAEAGADRVIVTSDNPRTEDPEAILNDIRRGMSRPTDALWIVDRREAIRESAARSADGDVVLIAGKGHEPYQVIGKEKFPFDDREEAKTWFNSAT